jgi:Glycosyltransferase family 87
VFLLARAAGAAHFALGFKLLMAACGAGAVLAALATLDAVRASRTRLAAAAAAMAVAPLAIGPICLNAYDLWPAFLLAVALALLVHGRPGWALGLLAAAAAAKVYPLAALLPAALYVDRRHGRAVLQRALTAFVAVAVVVNLPFAALGPGGLRYSYWVQLKRGLELNSLGASVLLAAQKLGLYDATIANRPPGSDNLIGRLPDAVATLSGLLVLAAIVAVATLFARTRRDGETLLLAAAASVAAFVALDKVFSAQYVDWLVPLVPLAGLVAAAAVLPVFVLTQEVFSHRVGIRAGGGAVWLLLVRNLGVLLAAGALTLRTSSRSRGWRGRR